MLIDRERDDDLEAEDQAIRDADKPQPAEPVIPVGHSLQRLIDEAIYGIPTPVQRQGQG